MAKRLPSINRDGQRPIGAIIGGVILGLVAAAIAVGLGEKPADDAGPNDDAQVAAVASGEAVDGEQADGQSDGVGGGDGSLDPVRVEPAEVKKPVGLDARAQFGTGVTAQISSIEPVEGQARGPGEISGPALRLTITIVNDSGEQIPLPEAAVGVMYGKQRTPAIALSEPGVDPFPIELNSGSTADGRYVFAVPPAARGGIRVTVAYSAEVPTAVFEGAAN